MHEFALTESLVDLVAERTRGRTVHAVHLRVGRLAGVAPEAMELCFEVATAGGPLEGAVLVVEDVPARLACRTCRGEEVVADAVLVCPRCGGVDVELTAGRELALSHVELRRDPAAPVADGPAPVTTGEATCA